MVMSLIESLTRIKNAVYGREVREAIHDGVFRANQIADGADAKADKTQIRQDAVENQFDAVQRTATEAADWGGEIIVASDGEATLGGRLDRDFGEINNKVSNVINLRDFSTNSFGILPFVDITQKINDAILTISELGGGKLIFPDDETYLIDGSVGVKLQSNVSLDFSSGAKLKVIPNALERYSCVVVRNVGNIEIINPHLIGDNADHFGVGGEWGFGLDIRNSQDVNIYNATATDFWGDGIYLGDENHAEQNNNVNFYGKTTVKRCRRQGMSVIAGNNCHVDYLYAEDIDGTQPEAAIDFEPNFSHQTITNFTVGKIRAVRCEEPALFVTRKNEFDITIDKIESIQCRNAYLEFVSIDHAPTSGKIKIGEVYYDQVVNRPLITAQDWHVGTSPSVSIDRIFVDKWDNSSLDYQSIYSVLRFELGKDSPAELGNFGGFAIGDVMVKDSVMSKPFTSIYVNRMNPTIVIDPTTKLSHISIALNPASSQKNGSVFGSILPVDYTTVNLFSDSAIEAVRAGDNTNLNTLINRAENLNKMTLINYDSGRPGVTNNPPGYGFILSFSGSSASFDIAFSSLDAKVYVRRLDANDSGSAWKELSQV